MGRRRGFLPVAVVVGLAVAGALCALALPGGLPPGVVLRGAVLGGLTSLTATGLILVHRSTGVVNMAQAAIGGVTAVLALALVTGQHWPYLVAVPVSIAAALAVGLAFDGLLRAGFGRATPFVLTVVTLGVLELLQALALELPRWLGGGSGGGRSAARSFRLPGSLTFRVHPYVFTADTVVAAVVVIGLGVAGWAWTRGDAGLALRGMADSPERVRLLGIDPRRLRRLTWVVAAGLSGLAATLARPVAGPGPVGPGLSVAALLAPLAAAVLADWDSVPMAVVWSVALTVVDQALLFSYHTPVYGEIVLFGAVVVGLVARSRSRAGLTSTAPTSTALTSTALVGMGPSSTDRSGDERTAAGWAGPDVMPLAGRLRAVREIQAGRVLVVLVAVAGLALVPLAFSASLQRTAAVAAIYGLIAVSLVVLTGWSGQVSLGQFALVGMGSAVAGSLLVHADVDVVLALALAGVAGAATAVVIGLPTLRRGGLALAVATLAFAVPVSAWLVSSHYLPGFAPASVAPPQLLRRFDLGSPATLYETCLVVLVAALVVARNLRRTRTGRAVVAVRESSRAAAAFGIDPLRTKVTALGVSGFLAGLAGALDVVARHGVVAGAYVPDLSVTVLVMAVIGGLGSLTGGVLGALAVVALQRAASPSLQLVATGAGVLVVLAVFPGGLGGAVYAFRDWLVAEVLRTLGTDPSAGERPAAAEIRPPPGPSPAAPAPSPAAPAPSPAAPLVLELADLVVEAGDRRVLDGVSLKVTRGQVVAVVGADGAGPSTLLRTVAGLVAPSAGRVVVGDVDVTDKSVPARVVAGLAGLLDRPPVLRSLTVADNLALAGARVGRLDPDFARAAHARVLELFPVLSDRALEVAGRLPVADQTRLGLAQALVCRPRLLLIDQLSVGLSAEAVDELAGVVRSLAAGGVTVVMAEWTVNRAAAAATRVVVLDEGRIAGDGQPPGLDDQALRLAAELHRSAAAAPGPPPTRARWTGPTAPRSLDPGPAEPESAPGASLVASGLRVHRAGVDLLVDVDFDVALGEVLGVIGADGAGKTLLLDVCSGFVRPDAGRVTVDGRDMTDVGPAARARLGLGRVFEEPGLWPGLTVTQALATALDRSVRARHLVSGALDLASVERAEAEVALAVDDLLDQMELRAVAERAVGGLPRALRRRLDLAGALAHRPRILLLDEPTAGLAPPEVDALAELLVALVTRTGTTVVLAGHDVALVASVADRALCLDRGRVVAQGPTAQVLDDPAVVRAYLGLDQSDPAPSGNPAGVATP